MIRCSISKPWITRGIQKTSHFCYLNTFYVLNVKTLNLYTTDSTILEIKYPVKVSSKYIYQVPTYPGTFEITDCGIINQENDHFQNLERLLFLLQSINLSFIPTTFFKLFLGDQIQKQNIQEYLEVYLFTFYLNLLSRYF